MIQLFWCEKTRASRLVWMLEELGEAYKRVRIDIRDKDMERPPSFDRASPMGKVPAIVDGDVAMAESAAICTYLADRYSLGTLAPALEDAKRGEYLYWMFYTPAVIEPAMADKFRGVEGDPLSMGWGSFDLMFEVLESRFGEGPFVLGDRFTAADVMIGGSLLFLRSFNALPASETLGAYADRLSERPGYQRALQLDG